MREATVASSLLIDFLAYLGRQGLAAERVCQAAQLDRRRLDDPHARVPAAAMERLWAAAEQLTGDPDLGLHSAAEYNPGALNILGYVILSCPDAATVLDRLARYAPLLNDGLRVGVRHEAGRTVCHFGAAEGVDSFLLRTPRQAVETLAAGIVLTLQRLAQPAPLPLHIHFRHAAPERLAEHRRLLGTALHFGQAENAVVYAQAALGAGLLSADPALLAVFEADARRRLELLPAHGSVGGRVQALVAARLKGEVPTLATVAGMLGMSERSVQRSLSDERTSYRDIVDQVRRTLALAHLARPGTTATDVAFLLGFSEPSAFTRAFRRWTGASPSRYRPA